MLSHVVRLIQDSEFNFDVITRDEAFKEKKVWDLKVKQTYLNNSNYELTVMDSLGMRITIPKNNDRRGKKGLMVIREYKFRHGLSGNMKGFLDEVTENDGVILNAIKKKFDNSDAFAYGGFGTEHQINYHFGHCFAVTLFYPENYIQRHSSVYCRTSGIVISKQLRQVMPPHPDFGLLHGFAYDPGALDKTIAVKSYRIVVNKPLIAKEKYYFTFGGEVLPAEAQNTSARDPGIYVMEYSRDIDSEVVEENIIKYIKFDEVTNKNGIFTQEYDAMLSLNPERTQRERDALLRERAHEIENLKFDNERIKHENDRVKLEMEERNTRAELELHGYKTVLARKNMELELLKSAISEKKHDYALEELSKVAEVSNLKHDYQMIELKEAREIELFKQEGRRDDHVLRKLEHGNKMIAMERDQKLNTAKFILAIKSMEAELKLNKQAGNRKVIDEAFKSISTVGTVVNTFAKLLM